MSWKTTAALLIFAIGLGTYLSLYELRQPSPEERERIAREILDIREESVNRLTLTTPQAETTLTREEGTWRLAPSGLRADPDRVSRCLVELAPLMSERTLSGAPEQPLELNAYGLNPPIASLTVVADQTPTTLLIGEEVAVGGRRYLQVAGRPEVFVVSSALFEAMDHPTEAFRDPSAAQPPQPPGKK